MNRFLVDMHAETTSFPHYWEQCVGSCHALTGLREDWRIQHNCRCRPWESAINIEAVVEYIHTLVNG